MTDQALRAAIEGVIREILDRQRIPNATYRVQFNEGFTFRDALALVPYWYDLGISDVYASPIFKSRSGSAHGYDICDHSQLSTALGSSEDFDAFAAALKERGMGLILDTVPNHMGIGDPCNAWWMDVLENGIGSAYAPYFDIDWHPVKSELEDKVLIPILEAQYGEVLEGGKFRLTHEDGAFFIDYYQTRLPVAPRTYTHILGNLLDDLTGTLGADNEQVQELQSILTALSYLPPRTEVDPQKLAERERETHVIKRRISVLVNANDTIRGALDATLQTFNGAVGDPRSFDRLDALLNDQPYRPAYWRVAAEEINYRRFFDINDLAAIRVEEPEVFQATHQLIFKLLGEGKINGLRIDHPDGLWNPSAYFGRLQEGFIRHQLTARLDAEGNGYSPDDLNNAAATWLAERPDQAAGALWPLYVIVEKILSESEPLPRDWAVYGTTGYDFMSSVNGLFVDGSQRQVFDGIYSRFIKDRLDFRELMISSKNMIMQISLASEINALGHQLERVTEKNRRYRDFTLNSMIFALKEVIACLGIYRTYITGPDKVSQRDQQYIEEAVGKAKRRNPRTADAIFNFIRDTLLMRNLLEFRPEDQRDVIDFVMKFQQVSGPVMAKSVEDTAFYIYSRLVSLNEVGSDPRTFGVSVREFHYRNAERRRCWPHAMLATSTHDTKRSEDVRARIDVLSEMPALWNAALRRWKRMNTSHKRLVDGEQMPDRNTEYLLYQTLIGAWPLEPYSPEDFEQFRERIAAYILKAAKEAKVHTSWINPNQDYDEALKAFVVGILSTRRFVEDINAFQRQIAYFGQFNGLAQQLLKLTSPGVPDIYQGTELWDLSLVDPDNRRPVDYNIRQWLLGELKSRIAEQRGLVQEFLDNGIDWRIKPYVVACALSYRRDHARLFAEGDYVPLEATGDKQAHVCAFTRNLADESVLIAVPRLAVGLVGGAMQPPIGSAWGDTWLRWSRNDRSYRDLFTGELLTPGEHNGEAGLSLATLLQYFPVALLAAT